MWCFLKQRHMFFLWWICAHKVAQADWQRKNGNAGSKHVQTINRQHQSNKVVVCKYCIHLYTVYPDPSFTQLKTFREVTSQVTPVQGYVDWRNPSLDLPKWRTSKYIIIHLYIIEPETMVSACSSGMIPQYDPGTLSGTQQTTKTHKVRRWSNHPINTPGFGGWGWLLDSNWCLYSQYFSVPCIISDLFSSLCRCYVWNQRFWIIFAKKTGNEKLGLLMSMSKID